MDKPEFICMGCGRDLGSKFALKTHKRVCGKTGYERGFYGYSRELRRREDEAARDAFADKVELASRDTKYHRFVNK